MATLIVLDTDLHTHQVTQKLTVQVEDGTVISEENAVDLLIDVGFIVRDEDFEESVDFYRDHEDISSNENAYTFLFAESTVTMILI